jgi:hypothetical protein
MKQTHQRQLGARRSACSGANAYSAREFIAELVCAHQETIALVRALLQSQERAEGRQADANHSMALAAANPADREAKDRAIEAAALADTAHLAEMYAADEWASHVMHLHGLMAMTDELYCIPVAAPRPAGPAAGATPLPRLRSRGDCVGWAGRPPRPAAE